jgi:branched-chain amino acid transport system permease protein
MTPEPLRAHRRAQRRVQSAAGFAAVAAATLAVPAFLNPPQTIVYVTIGLATMVVAGLSLLMGSAGQVSLGQGAFYGIGAYTAAILAVHGWPPLLALVVAPVATAVIAALLGVPLLRLEGHALAFGTLAVQLIMLSVLDEVPGLTGGAVGLSGLPNLTIGPLSFSSYRSYAYLVWVLAATVLVVNRNLVRSRPGRGLMAMASSPEAAAASGVTVVTYKLRVFVLSSVYAGLAGGVYAFFLGHIDPGAFPVILSIEYVIMAVVGGLGTVAGAFLGPCVIIVLSQVLTSVGTSPSLPPQLPSVLSDGVYALVLIAALRLLPAGVVGLLKRVLDRTGAARTGPA